MSLSEIQTALEVLIPAGEVVEIRALGDGANPDNPGKSMVRTGYYDDLAAAARDAWEVSQSARGTYFSLNFFQAGLLERSPNRISTARLLGTTSAKDIERRRWILVDIEAPRPPSSNATEEELGAALTLAKQIETWMLAETGCFPVATMSGNGAHLLYRCDLPNTPEVTGQVKAFLGQLAALFDSPWAKVDTSVSDPSRICKLPGTMTRKGPDDPDRPQRRAKLLSAGWDGTLDGAWLARFTPPEPKASEAHPVRTERGDAFARAQQYMSTRKPAVAGQNGDQLTLNTAVLLFHDFALPDDQAWELFEAWNATCLPPWTKADLERKVARVPNFASKPRGWKLDEPLKNASMAAPVCGTRSTKGGALAGTYDVGRALEKALRKLLDERNPWTGSPEELYGAVPIGSAAKALGFHITNHQDALARAGVFISKGCFGVDRKRVYSVSSMANVDHVGGNVDLEVANVDLIDVKKAGNVDLEARNVDLIDANVDQEEMIDVQIDLEARNVDLIDDTKPANVDQEEMIDVQIDVAIDDDRRSSVKSDPPTVNPPEPPEDDEDEDGEDDGDDLNRFVLTDLGNAEAILHLYGERLRWFATAGKWLTWTGTHWMIDKSNLVLDWANRTMRRRRFAAAKSKKKREWALQSESARGRNNALAQVLSFPKYVKHAEDLDRDLWKLSVKNGTLDLRTGQLHPHRQADYITKLVPINYDPNAKCPLWDAFLAQMHAGEPETVRYLQQAAGYSLTGITSEHSVFIMHGQGSNGKSLFLELICECMGEYAKTTKSDTFAEKPIADAISNALARLDGARIVKASETNASFRLDEAQIKGLSGEDTVTARFLHKEFFEFQPRFKVWIVTNHKPIVQGTDYGIWRRLKLIPWNVVIPKEKADKGLRDKLRRELPGILAWLVRGCLDWQRAGGLVDPPAVVKAIQQYQEEQDTLAGFLKECCSTEHPLFEEAADVLFRAYCDWAEGQGIRRPMAQKTMTSKLKEKGFEWVEGRKFHKTYFKGLKVIASHTKRENSPEVEASKPYLDSFFDNL